MVRLLGLRVVAAVCLRGVANGTIPLLLVAGGALYVASLDAVESMAQEADHPGRSEGLPRPVGDLLVRHLGVGALVSGITAYFCIALFLRLLDRLGLMPFVYYRVILAAVLYGLWLA